MLELRPQRMSEDTWCVEGVLYQTMGVKQGLRQERSWPDRGTVNKQSGCWDVVGCDVASSDGALNARQEA